MHKNVTGLSGNEIYCLNLIGQKPGPLLVGNSVAAIGVLGGLSAGFSTLGGGEVSEITELIHRGRQASFDRLMKEAENTGLNGVTGVSFDLINHGGNLEFITIGSAVTAPAHTRSPRFSTSADAQQLYCQMDAGFEPLSFVFGNVAYSIGLGGNIAGSLRSMVRGEVEEFTRIFDETRHLALKRIREEARVHGANAVVGIKTTIAPILGSQEMMMVGTASHHAGLDHLGASALPVTSDMTNEEMWNMVHLGYAPIELVMGVSVYSLGFAGGVGALLKTLRGGEVTGLTEILYEAREKALSRLQEAAHRAGADEVVGVKVRVYDLGRGMVELMAIGTAVKKLPGFSTRSSSLPAQAIIKDQETLVDSTDGVVDLGRSQSASAPKMQRGALAIVLVMLFFIFRILIAVLNNGTH